MNKIGLKIIGILIISIIILQSTTVMAVSSDQVQLQNEQNKVQNDKKEAEEQLKKVKIQKSETVKQVEQLSSQIEEYQSQINTLNDQISQLNEEITKSQEKLNKAQSDYKKQQELLDARLVATYEAGETSYLDVILSSANIVDLISNYYLVTEVATNDTELLEKIEKQKQEIETVKVKLENDKQKLDTSKSSKQQIATKLQASKQEKNSYVSQLSEQEKQLQKEIDELKEHENSIRNRIEQMQREYDQQNNGSSSYGFGWPVTNHAIGTRYGVAGSYWSSGYHTGVDFPVPTGTPVYAVGNGKVFDTGYNSAYGNFVEIYHGNNLYSFYAHASSVKVSVGQNVSKGQQIMLSGSSGNVTGAHLHFEIRTPGYKYANCVNPMKYLP